jgi:D-3-phosphoglycerate dehydrogenase
LESGAFKAANMTKIVIPDDSPSVLATSAVFPALKARAEVEHFDTLPFSDEALIDRIRHAEVVINIRASTKFTARVFQACRKLRLLSVWGTGIDHVDLPAASRFGVTVTNTPGVSAVSIAEHAMALMFAVARHIPQIDHSTRAGTWERGHFVELRGKTCGVIGYGAIGREFARLAGGVGMKVLLWTMHPERYPDVAFTDLFEIFATSDVISLHLRLSPDTQNFVGLQQFGMMKPNAILINTARGAIVDERAMVAALVNHRIAGAGLDVYASEPVARDHPLNVLGNVVLTPHCAGATPEALEAGLAMAAENIWAFLRGAPEHVV